MISSGGREYAWSGGVVSAATISAGGAVTVSSGGTAIGAEVLAGGGATVLSGGVGSALVVSGGTLVISISFTGSSGDLALANLGGFAAEIAGMSVSGQKVDLLGFGYSGTESATWSQGTGGGTLTVTDGARVATRDLIGTYVTSNFTLSNDGQGGTFVVDPPVIRAAAGATRAVAHAGGSSTDALSDLLTEHIPGDLVAGGVHLYIGGLGPAWHFADAGNYGGTGAGRLRQRKRRRLHIHRHGRERLRPDRGAWPRVELPRLRPDALTIFSAPSVPIATAVGRLLG